MPSMMLNNLILGAAGLAYHVAAQTPEDFTPNSLVRLGITYPKINIDPPGTLSPQLDC